MKKILILSLVTLLFSCKEDVVVPQIPQVSYKEAFVGSWKITQVIENENRLNLTNYRKYLYFSEELVTEEITEIIDDNFTQDITVFKYQVNDENLELNLLDKDNILIKKYIFDFDTTYVNGVTKYNLTLKQSNITEIYKQNF